MTDLADLAAVIRSGQVSHRDAQAIVDRTPGLREHMAETSITNGKFTLNDGSPAGPWQSGPVTLVGDAEVHTMPPMAWTVFAQRYPASVGAAGLTAPLPWSMALSRELAAVNDRVNAIPEDTRPQDLSDTWDVSPPVADCNDYAVTKRDALLRAGHPASVLLLAEVVLHNGKNHLVLVVRTSRDQVILDSLTRALLSRQDAAYTFKRMQSPRDPNSWVGL